MLKFLAKDCNTYQIDLDDDQEIKVYDANGKEVGSISFLHVTNEDFGQGDYYYLTDLSLEKCKRLGIGTEIFRLHKEIYNEPITAAEDSGQRYSDGSHLVNDGVPFVAKMRELGFICPDSNTQEFTEIDDY
ncbi:hypothetical protein [Plesiomonas sp.]|uniref:hypothetical protein n=1 Tax=Plesiomonas sp. TaxID=2486279 RepID=UPI003F2FB701